jgi:hypothetical protein
MTGGVSWREHVLSISSRARLRELNAISLRFARRM